MSQYVQWNSFFLAYFFIVGGIISRIMPKPALLALITAVFAWKAVVITFRNYDKEIEKIIPALKNNVIMILGIDILLALGYLLDFALS